MQLTAIIEKGDKYWVGRIEEIPGALSQGRTKAELLDNLKDAAAMMIASNRKDARKSFTKGNFAEKKITVAA